MQTARHLCHETSIKTAPEATQKRFFFTTNHLYDAALWDLFRQDPGAFSLLLLWRKASIPSSANK